MGFFMPRGKTRRIDKPSFEIAKKIGGIIADIAGSGDKIHSGNIPDIIRRIAGDVNCYPSNIKGSCMQEAYFISLTSKSYATDRGHLSFKKALECIVQHMQGSCYNYTKVAILVSDSWDTDVFNDWRDNLEQIKRERKIVEAYIISGNTVSQMQI